MGVSHRGGQDVAGFKDRTVGPTGTKMEVRSKTAVHVGPTRSTPFGGFLRFFAERAIESTFLMGGYGYGGAFLNVGRASSNSGGSPERQVWIRSNNS